MIIFFTFNYIYSCSRSIFVKKNSFYNNINEKTYIRFFSYNAFDNRIFSNCRSENCSLVVSFSNANCRTFSVSSNKKKEEDSNKKKEEDSNKKKEEEEDVFLRTYTEFEKAFYERWKKDLETPSARNFFYQWWLFERRNFSKFLKRLEFVILPSFFGRIKSFFKNSKVFISEKCVKPFRSFLYQKYIVEYVHPIKRYINRKNLTQLILFIVSWTYAIVVSVFLLVFFIFVFLPLWLLGTLVLLLFDFIVFYIIFFFFNKFNALLKKKKEERIISRIIRRITTIIYDSPKAKDIYNTVFSGWSEKFERRIKTSWFWSWFYKRYDLLGIAFSRFYKISHEMYLEYWFWHYGEMYSQEDSIARSIGYPRSWTWSDAYFDGLSDYERVVRYRRVTRRVIFQGLFYDLPLFWFEKIFKHFKTKVLPFYLYSVYEGWKRFLQSFTLFYYGDVAAYSRLYEWYQYTVRGFEAQSSNLLSDRSRPSKSNVLANCFGSSFLNLESVLAIQLEENAKKRKEEEEWIEDNVPPSILDNDGSCKKRFSHERNTMKIAMADDETIIKMSDEEAYLRKHYKWMFDKTRMDSKFYDWRTEEEIFRHSFQDPYPLIPLRIGIYTGRFAWLQKRLDELDWVNYVEIKTRAWVFRNDSPSNVLKDYLWIEKNFDEYNYTGYWNTWASNFYYMNEDGIYPEYDDGSNTHPYYKELIGEVKSKFFLRLAVSLWFCFCFLYAIVAFIVFPFVIFFQILNQITSVPIVEKFWFYAGYCTCFVVYTLPMNWRRVFWPAIKLNIYIHVYLFFIKPVVDIVFSPRYLNYFYTFFVNWVMSPTIHVWRNYPIFIRVYFRAIALSLFYFFGKRFAFTVVRIIMILEHIFFIVMEFFCCIHYFLYIFPEYVAPGLIRKYFFDVFFYEIVEFNHLITSPKIYLLVQIYNKMVVGLRILFFFLFSLFRYVPLCILIWYTWYVLTYDELEWIIKFIYCTELFFYPYTVHPYTMLVLIQYMFVWSFKYACPPFSKFFDNELSEIYWTGNGIIWLAIVHPGLNLRLWAPEWLVALGFSGIFPRF